MACEGLGAHYVTCNQKREMKIETIDDFRVIKTRSNKIDEVMPIYSNAVLFMRANGNHEQWTGGYPSREKIMEDIIAGNHYSVLDEEGRLSAVFTMIIGEEPTYKVIEGAWLNDYPYATLHRVASAGLHPFMLEECVRFAKEKIDNIRIDTHLDNIPMQNSLRRIGFKRCGMISLADGSPRVAFQLPLRPLFLKNELINN